MSIDNQLFATPPTIVRVEDCHFYHTMEVPGEGVVYGDFDLRGGVDDYLGHVPLNGRRVLEIGPASGFLTFHMESRGASVAAVEIGPDAEWDIVPQAELDLATIRKDRLAIMERLRNGFWLAHQRTGSRAKVHYGNVYELPDELGHFDVAIMAAVLLHTRDPLRIIEGCARRADTVVITEMHKTELDGAPLASLVPSRESGVWDTWWDFSPDFFTQFLGILGFRQSTVTYHTQPHFAGGAEYQIPFFTLVASR
jgi:SAM-dependent methyltransferase